MKMRELHFNNWENVPPNTDIKIYRNHMEIKANFIMFYDQLCWVKIGRTGNIMTLQGISPEHCDLINKE